MRIRLLFLIAALGLSIPSFGAITGTVMTRDGVPVAGARVSLFSLELAEARRERIVSATPERAPLAIAQTDSKGNFRLETKEAVADLRIEAKGFAPQSVRVEKDEETGAIALTRAEMKQGAIAGGGKPVAGATVVWIAGPLEVVARTDENGRYSVPDPSKWAQRLIVFHSGWAPIDEPVGPFSPNAKKGADRTLDTGVALTGKVLSSDGRSAVAKARISIDGLPLATSADDGTFTVAHAPRTWDVLQARAGELLGVRARTKETAITVRMAKGGRVGGVVRDAKTRAPLAGAEVRLGQRMAMDAVPLASSVSDAKGHFDIAGVPPGQYELLVTRAGYSAPASSITVTPGESVQKTIAAIPMARITGTVVDEERKGVAAAAVSAITVARDAFAMMIPASQGLSRRAFSGPDGRFVVLTRGDEEVNVTATKKGYPPARSSFRIAAGERKDGVTLTIPRGLPLTGRVTDRDGKPLSGVTVTASESEGGPGGPMRRVAMMSRIADDEDNVQTASDGSFELRLKEGSYDLMFRREGLAPKIVRNHALGSSSTPLEVTLEPGAEIAGRVSRGGAGVEGVSVFAMGSDSQANTTTAPDGSFVIADLAPGPVMLAANKPDEYIQQIRNVTAPARDVVIEIPPAGRITGRVVEKGSKKPLTNFQVGVSGIRGGGAVTIAMPGQMRTFTSDDGTFVLENVPPGTHTLMVQSAGFTMTRVPGVVVEEGKAAEVEVELDHGVRVSGRVTGPDGAPLSGATVRVEIPGAGPLARVPGLGNTAATDANGEYVIEAVESGERTMEFSAPGLVTETRTVELTGREVRVDATLSAGLRVTGQVVTDSGAPVADAAVNASSAAAGGFGRRARTDANGMFQIEGLTPGHYTFTAEKNGLSRGILRDVDISAGAPLRITMTGGGVIYGRVTGLAPEELSHATVNAFSPTGSASAPVDANGNFRIEGAPTGSVRVGADVTRGGFFGNSRSSPRKSVELEPGGSVQVDIEFPNDTVISGRITRNGRPLGGATVAFIPTGATSQTRSSATADEGGHYSLSVAPGSYSVTVMDVERLNPYTTNYEVKGSGTFDIDVRTAQVRGRVLDAASGEPVGGAIVQLRRGQGPESVMSLRSAETDAGGAFVLDSVSPGTYSATATKDGYGSEVREVTIGDRGGEAIEIRLSRNDGVTLQVIDARDGRPLNASVVVFDAQNRIVHEEFFRFSAGTEPLRLRLAPGTYRAFVQAAGYAPRTVVLSSPSRQTIDLSPGGTLIVRSKAATARRGRLLDPSGQPYYPRNPFFVLDANPGLMTFQNVAPGTYTLQILGDGNTVVDAKSVTVVEGRTTQTEM
ncbi:MAG TPA: carboxypeptidase regulatory-like domain-containing protein [Thermoanaerobaculia bacterium]|nr:carboxypeptidase regulatory-like domain-containing protein [Thermoanaerobaculia bacterium]